MFYTTKHYQRKDPLLISMDSPAVLLLCLEQEQKRLEAHTSGFLDLVSLNFPNRSLCLFYLASMNKQTTAQLPSVGPFPVWASFTQFVKWVLVCNGSPYNVCLNEEELTSPALTPAQRETSHPPASEPTGMHSDPITAHGLLRWMSLNQGRGLREPSPCSPFHSMSLTRCVSRQHRRSPRQRFWHSRTGRKALPTCFV